MRVVSAELYEDIELAATGDLVGIGLRTQWESDGFAESDGFGGHLQEVSPDRSREENFLQNPSQPVTLPEPVTSPTCDDGCGAPVEHQGELCDRCADAAHGGGPL